MVLSTFCRLIQLTFMLIMSSLLTPSATSSSDMLFIRHGRSRVRHSNEKDYLRWSLKALDNLTLDYDITDSYDNDTLILFGNDIWSLDNMTYFNQTSNYSSSFSSSAKPSDERLLPTTMTPATSLRKKVPKKKLMESIRKNVDKGLEYLKMHQNLQVPVNNQEFGYQSDDASSKLLLRNDATKPPSESELAKVSTTETTKPEGYASYAYKNLPHSVPARLSVPYKQQLVTREGDTNNLDNNDRNVSAINLSIDDDDMQSIRHGLSMDDDGMEIDGGPYQAPSTSGFSNGASGESPSGNVDEGDDAEDDDDSILANVYGTSDEDLSDLDEISRKNRLNLMKGRDVVTKFLQIVESQHLLGANCTAGTALNLGEGVVDQYAQDRFRIEAEVAVNRANMLTRIFKLTSPSVQASEHLLHASVLSMVEFDDDIFAAGNCFDWNQHPSKSGLFCPFAYRLPPPDQGASFAKDLAAEYHYLGNTSEWFFLARKNAEKVIAKNDQYIKAYHYYSNSTSREADVILSVKYDDGRWSKPYYDCGGGNIWMLTYTVPFFGFENETYFFKGTSGIDIDLRRVDIDQCPQRSMPGTIQPLNIFAGTDKCKQRTTMCEPITGLGFRRGSYKCLCRKGFYFPETTAIQKYFNGSVLEEEYEKLMLGETSTYSKSLTYECLPCAEGCDFCEDSSPCVAALNWTMRTSILVLACAVIGLLPPAAWFTFRYQQVKVVRAASPALLRVIALGAFFIYCTTIVMYPPPSLYTCTARIWLREIGFSLTYGALMLKTWRISVIFRVRSAKAVKITDAALLKRLGVICGAIGACLLIRTVVSPPEVVVGRTADDLKAFLCKTDWWDYTFTSMEVLFLAWGVRLCIMVRKAPSEFNESRFISMAIYNEFLLTCFLNVSMLFLQSPANPDLLYIIFFCHTQLTVTLLLGLIFGSKVYIVLRSGKSQENTIGLGAKSSGAKFNFRPQIRTFANPSTATSSTAQLAETRLTDQEALEELRQLSLQLQRIQELAPPRGAAVMTISSLLDGLKTTTHQLAIKPPSSNTLPIPALGNDLQKPNTSKRPVSTLEKSINTQLTGDDFWQQLSIEKSNSRNSNCHHITITDDDCNQHPLEIHRKERCNLSFSELHLECMCAEAVEDIESLGDQNHHRHSFDRIDNVTNRDRCTTLSDRHKQLKSPTKPKFHSSCNLNQSKTNNSNLCDNHKSNDHFLICDNCKKKFVNIESKAIEVSLDSHDDISFHSSDNDDHRQTQQCVSDSQNQAFSSTNLDSDYTNNDNGTDLKKGQSRKSEKLVLDLNDRSKYTKEVSV